MSRRKLEKSAAAKRNPKRIGKFLDVGFQRPGIRDCFLAIFLFFLFCVGHVSAQSAFFTVEVSTDTLLIGNLLEVRYSIENAQGDFESPDFEGFDIVSGPNISSRFSMINGKSSQQSSYTYYLSPISAGLVEISPARITGEDLSMETASVQIVVMENPEGAIQRPGQLRLKQRLEQKDSSAVRQDSIRTKLKKLKTYKI
jgi:hypothetical protein